MPLFIRITEARHDPAFLRVCLPVHLRRDRLPLAGGGFKPHVPVGGDPFAVHQQADTSLMAFRIDILEGDHIDPLVCEVTCFLVKTEFRLFFLQFHDSFLS